MMGHLLLSQILFRIYEASLSSANSLLTSLQAQTLPLLQRCGVARGGQSLWAFTAHSSVEGLYLFSTTPMFSKAQGLTQCGQTGRSA